MVNAGKDIIEMDEVLEKVRQLLPVWKVIDIRYQSDGKVKIRYWLKKEERVNAS